MATFERPIVHLGQAECCSLGGDYYVGASHQPYPRAQTVAVHRDDHRYCTLVYRSEGVGAGTVSLEDPFVARKFLHLDDVHPSTETTWAGKNQFQMFGG